MSSNIRFFLGLALGCGLTLAVSSQLMQHPSQQKPAAVGQNAVEGPRVPVNLSSPEQLATIRAREERGAPSTLVDPAASVQTADVSASSANDKQLFTEMVRYGVPESQARKLIDKYGTVKVRALVEREKERMLESQKEAPATVGDSAPRPGTLSGTEPSSPVQVAAESAPAVPADPYAALNEERAAFTPQSEEELAESRRQSRASYLAAVAGQAEALGADGSGAQCASGNCPPQL